MPGLIDVETLGGHRYDGNLAGVKGGFAGLESENAGSTRGQNAGVAGGARGALSPVSIGVPASFYEDVLKITTAGDEAGGNHVVAVPPHRSNGSLNGNGHHAGVTTWPA